MTASRTAGVASVLCAIVAQIERKVDGHEISMEPQEEPKAQVIDLMAALKSSLAKKAGERRPAKRAPRKATARGRKSTTKKARSSRR